MDFNSDIMERLEEGKIELSNNIKFLLFQQHPEWCDLLDFEDEQIFNEPLLYAFFNFNKQRLLIPQILFGYVNQRPRNIQVHSDANGRIYLPNLCYLKTSLPNDTFDLYSEGDEIVIKKESKLVPYQKTPVYFLPESSIEVCRFNNPAFSNFFTKDGELHDAKIDATFNRHISSLEKAFLILKENASFPFEAITQAVGKMVLYNTPVQRSFASLRANGAAFFNVRESMDEVFLLEDITHQCGHVVYYYVLWDKEAYFKCDVQTPLQHFTKNANDKRTVLGGFYSLLPFALSNLTSSACYLNRVFKGDQQIEFEGRFAFRMHKFLMDIRNFDNREIFTKKGWTLFNQFKSISHQIYETHKDVIERFDIGNQGYEFDISAFRDLNEKHFELT